MIDLTVKTLDSKNHHFSVPDDFTVKNLKERIADSVNIPADSQRLIYCGRVLQDEKNLSEYDVNGKVIHLVQRAPPTSNGSGPDRGPRSQTGTGGARRTPLRIIGSPGNANHAMYLGAMAFPTEVMDASGVSMEQPRPCLSQSRLNVVKSMLDRTSRVLDRLENPSQNTPESTDSSPDNGNSEGSAEEDGGATPLATPIPAAVGISTATITPTVIVDLQPVIDLTSTEEDLTDPVAGGPSVEVQTEASSSAEPSQAAAAASTTTDSEAQTSNPSESRGAQTEGEEASRYPRPQALADLLDQYNTINGRLQPFMNQYQQLLRDDPTFPDQDAVSQNRRVFYGVSEIMHNLGHAFHTMSDIMCDFTQAPPRTLRCRPVLIQHSALVQTGIPIQIAASASLFGGGPNAASRGAPPASAPSTAPAPNTAESAEPAPASPAAQSIPTVHVRPRPTAQVPPTPQAQATPTTQAAETTPTPTTTTQAQGTTTQQQSPLRFRQAGGGGHPGFEIFVDVAPGSITIDSVETHVLNVPISSGGTANTTTESTDPNIPPDLVQNLISALTGQFLGATMQQYQQQRGTGATPSTTGASTATGASTTSAESPTWASSANAQEAAVNSQNSQARGNTATNPTTATRTRSTPRPHVHIPVHGLPGNSFDPFLPCNSHHIRRSGASRRQRVEQTQAREGRATATGSSRTESGARANTSRHGHRPVPMTGHGISISLRADPTSRHRRTVSPTVIGATGFPPQLQAFLRSLLASNAPGQGFPAPMGQLLDAFFDGQNNSTLAQILQNVTGYSYTPGESIFTDIFMILAQSLTFTDILQLGLGNSECLTRARPQLRELVSQRLLHNQPLSPAGISEIIDHLNTEIATVYPVFEVARFREEIDLPASINSINHQMLPAIFTTTMEEDEATFHRTLVRKCTQYLRLLCALLLHCCLDGAAGLEAILTCFVNQMTTGVPRPLQEWTTSHSIQNFRTFTSSTNVSTDEIRRFIVYRMANPAASSPQPATTPPTIPPAAEPMDVEEAAEVEIESTPIRIREPPVADTPPVNDSIGWQNTLPSEWVPIITRDAQRQRRQSSQGPFSDAYLSGMPSKRRKLITSAKPQGNLSQVISESMASALGAAGMRSGPEVDVIAQRAGQDSNLRTAYREQVRTTLRHNLNSNPDYLPDKYPNTAKYFKKP